MKIKTPITAGITRFIIHKSTVAEMIPGIFTEKIPRKITAAEPLIPISKILNTGIIELTR